MDSALGKSCTHMLVAPFEDDDENDGFLRLKREDTWKLSWIGKAEQRITEPDAERMRSACFPV
jgi:hypothetical protein